MKKSNVSFTLCAVISSLITVLALSLIRLYFISDLMDRFSIDFNSFLVLSVFVSFALVPPFALLILMPIFKKLIRIETLKKRSPFIRRLGLLLVGILLFSWGFFSIRIELHYFVNIIQGMASLLTFSLTYYSLNKLFKGNFGIAFQRAAAVLILFFWGIYTVFLLFKSADYLNSAIPPDYLRVKGNLPNILMLGIDGMEWHIANKLIDSGELPNISALKNSGAYAPLRTFKPTSSPFIWNTIFTGYNPEIHQLRPSVISLPFNTIFKRSHSAFPDPFQIGAELLVPGNRRITHYPLAYWEILMRIGYSSAVIGTWELSPLSCRGLVNLTVNRYSTDNLSKMSLEGDYFYNELDEFVESINIRQDQIPFSEWSYFTISGEVPEELFTTTNNKQDIEPWLKRLAYFRTVYATDRFRFLLGKQVLSTLQQPFSLMLYLQGLDITSHYYMHLFRDRYDSIEENDFKEIIPRYYRKIDEWVGDLISIAPPNTVILLLSDHGFDLDYVQPFQTMTGFHLFAPDGVFIIAGHNIPKGELEKVHILDITPTILDIVGVPELISMQGRSALLQDDYNIHIKDWYSMQIKAMSPEDSRFRNPEIDKRLRELGYIK